MSASAKPPFLGFGLGLRAKHYQDILASKPAVDWFEVLSENYMVPGGQALNILDRIRADYPVVMHGVSLSIASTAPLNTEYLQDLKTLAKRVQPKWISDHLCWTGVHGRNLHDLLPIPYTEEALDHVVERVKRVQDFLGRQIVLENVSSYVSFKDSEMAEWEFLSELSSRADCWLLFDVNNVYVSAFNQLDWKVQCFGVNSCKGTGGCKTATNECKGQNSCKGKGFVMLSESDCTAKGGTTTQG